MADSEDRTRHSSSTVSRRTLVAAVAAGAGAIALGAPCRLGRRCGRPDGAAEHDYDAAARLQCERSANDLFRDPDVIAVDPSFNGSAQPNAAIQRLWTGALWSEGPAWNAQGRYLLWSDIPNNRQLRWLEDDGTCQRVPHADEQQQRQYLRLPRPADFLRTSFAGASFATSSTGQRL